MKGLALSVCVLCAHFQAKSLKQQLLSLEDRLQVAVSGADSLQQDHNKSLAALKQKGEELERKNRELQDKFTKANERSKKVGEELEAEHKVSEKLRRELADVAAQKSAETRKTAVEISRIKVCSFCVLSVRCILYMQKLHTCCTYVLYMMHEAHECCFHSILPYSCAVACHQPCLYLHAQYGSYK